MKRSTKLALSLVLAAGTVAPAFAQDNFPDVPANHWAYEALARMKRDGLLVGYPDGLYRGGRPASRYELAVAMHAVYTNLKNVTDGLDAQIRALSANNGGTTAADIASLKDAVAALQADLAAMRGYGDDIAALKRAAEVFDRELKSLGVDVEAMKKDLVDLSGRVSALEQKKPAIDVTGDVNLLIYAGNSSGNLPFLSQDGRFAGLKGNGTGTSSPAGLTDDASVLHEAAFTFTSTKTTGPKFTGTVVVGNILPFQGNQSQLPPGVYNDSGVGTFSQFGSGSGSGEDIYVQNLEVSFGGNFLHTGYDLTLGRVGVKTADPYLFQRIDNTSYYSNERWDNGKYYLDGGTTDFKLFGIKIGAFAGRTSGRSTVNGRDLDPVVIGNNRVAGNAIATPIQPEFTNTFGTGNTNSSNDFGGSTAVSSIDRVLGLTAAFPLTKVGNINLAYLWLDHDSTSFAEEDGVTPSLAAQNSLFGQTNANRVEAYGGDVNFTFHRLKVSGSLNQSNLDENSSRIVDGHNLAFDAKVAFTGNRFNAYAKYREIGANYIAPGDWDRLGILRNPANIRGFVFGGGINLSNLLVLSGSGETNTGLDNGGNLGYLQPFDQHTTINNYAVRLDYKLSPNASVFGSFEDTRFADLANGFGDGATAKYRFATFGVGYGLSPSAKLNVSYQYGDVANEAFLGSLADTGLTTNRYKGGLLTTQLTVKF